MAMGVVLNERLFGGGQGFCAPVVGLGFSLNQYTEIVSVKSHVDALYDVLRLKAVGIKIGVWGWFVPFLFFLQGGLGLKRHKKCRFHQF